MDECHAQRVPLNAMVRAFYLLVLGMVVMVSCHKRVEQKSAQHAKVDVTESSSDDEAMGMAEGPTHNQVIAKVLERRIDRQRFEGHHPCNDHPCDALVEIVAITQLGMDFHGQIEEGMQVDVHFTYTLDPSDDLFPELNQPLPGLEEGAYFEAILLDDAQRPGGFVVKLYEKKA